VAVANIVFRGPSQVLGTVVIPVARHPAYVEHDVYALFVANARELWVIRHRSLEPTFARCPSSKRVSNLEEYGSKQAVKRHCRQTTKPSTKRIGRQRDTLREAKSSCGFATSGRVTPAQGFNFLMVYDFSLLTSSTRDRETERFVINDLWVAGGLPMMSPLRGLNILSKGTRAWYSWGGMDFLVL
jgi:hypothetical protein